METNEESFEDECSEYDHDVLGRDADGRCDLGRGQETKAADRGERGRKPRRTRGEKRVLHRCEGEGTGE